MNENYRRLKLWKWINDLIHIPSCLLALMNSLSQCVGIGVNLNKKHLVNDTQTATSKQTVYENRNSIEPTPELLLLLRKTEVLSF